MTANTVNNFFQLGLDSAVSISHSILTSGPPGASFGFGTDIEVVMDPRPHACSSARNIPRCPFAQLRCRSVVERRGHVDRRG